MADLGDDRADPVADTGPWRWWDAHGEYWTRELDAYAAAGMEVVNIADGVLRTVTVAVPADSHVSVGSAMDGVPFELEVTYPSRYPFFAPAVHDRAGALDWAVAHRGVDGLVCLGREQSWSLHDSAGEMLSRQLPAWLLAADGQRREQLTVAELAAVDDGIAETPELAWAAMHAGVLVHTSCPGAMDADVGSMEVAFASNPSAHASVAALLSVTDAAGACCWSAPDTMRRELFHWMVRGMWVRIDSPPARLDRAGVEHHYRELARRRTQLRARAGADVRPELAGSDIDSIDGLVDVLGWTWSDPARGGVDRWAFFIATRPTRRHSWAVRLVLGDPAGRDVSAARTGNGTAAALPHAALVGVGAIGSTLALALARGGLDALTLIDADHVSFGNLTRHAGTVLEVGIDKVSAIRWAVMIAAPECVIGAIPVRLGATDADAYTEALARVAEQQLARADIVIDAAANPALTRYLAAAARAHGKWFVSVAATAGAWGGRIVILSPQPSQACWACLEYAQAAGELPVPPADPAGVEAAWPPGCAEPTFTGTGADLDSISTAAARVVLEIAFAGDGHPQLAVATLREPHTGAHQHVAWQAVMLARHRECENHRW